MREIRSFPVPRHAVALWWFGQNGYIFKTREGTLTSVDLYLTDSCSCLNPGFNLSRRVPILLPPDELELDVFACTHNHQDHTDPETIRNLRHKDTMQFVGPMPSCAIYRQEGVEEGRVVPSWPSCQIEWHDLRLDGTFALPTDHTDLNHMGLVLEFSGGPKVYITGDTDDTPLLYEAARHSPGLMITCINGGFNNLSHWEAADLASHIRPRAAIPCHYDMFPDNAADPKQFRSALHIKAPDVGYHELEHGKPFVFSSSN